MCVCVCVYTLFPKNMYVLKKYKKFSIFKIR